MQNILYILSNLIRRNASTMIIFKEIFSYFDIFNYKHFWNVFHCFFFARLIVMYIIVVYINALINVNICEHISKTYIFQIFLMLLLLMIQMYYYYCYVSNYHTFIYYTLKIIVSNFCEICCFEINFMNSQILTS